MALTECWECGDDVSTAAEVCPNCGAPNPAPEVEPDSGSDVREGECKRCSRQIEIAPGDSCPHCRQRLPLTERSKARHSGSRAPSEKSDGLAAVLGLLLGPVGLWYKRNWAAGFAWLAGAVVLGVVSGGVLAPILWIGMAIHAYSADVK